MNETTTRREIDLRIIHGLRADVKRLEMERNNLRETARRRKVGIEKLRELRNVDKDMKILHINQRNEAVKLLQDLQRDLGIQQMTLDKHGGTLSIRIGVVSILKHIITRRIPDVLANL